MLTKYNIVSDYNKRKIFRINLYTPLCIDLTICEVNGKRTSSGWSRVCSYDIGPGGLSFITNLDFPISETILYNFKFALMGEVTNNYGFIVRKAKTDQGPYEYGVCFVIDETVLQSNIKLFNKLSIGFRSPLVKVLGSFCTKESSPCFKHQVIYNDLDTQYISK